MGIVNSIDSLSVMNWSKQLGRAVLSMATDPSLGKDRDEAYEDGDKEGEFQAPGCCNLVYYPDNQCPYTGRPANYTCPPGFTRRWWTCVEGTGTRVCGECAQGRTCWQGPFHCSIWWWA